MREFDGENPRVMRSHCNALDHCFFPRGAKAAGVDYPWLEAMASMLGSMDMGSGKEVREKGIVVTLLDIFQPNPASEKKSKEINERKRKGNEKDDV